MRPFRKPRWYDGPLQTLGCATVLGAVAFAIAFVGILFTVLFDTSATWSERLQGVLVGSLTVGAVTTCAAAFLFTNDRLKYVLARQRVRRRLLQRDEVSDEAFCAAWPEHEAELLIAMRTAIAEFLDVPSTKIHPQASLRRDLEIKAFAPGFLFFVANRLMRSLS